MKKTKLPISFEEVCKLKGYDPATIIPDFSSMPEKFRKHLAGMAKLYLIVDCLNDRWEPNWNDDNEYKYFPYFWMDSPGFRFDFSDSYCDGAVVGTGSRLCFRTKVLSDHAATHFLEIYKEIMVIEK